MNEDNKTTETLGTEPIGKLLISYSIPAIIAMTTASLYNIIDRIFIGQGIGSLAISGLALTFPVMNLAVAFGSLVGVGASSIASIRLGQKNWQDATTVLGNALILNIIIGLLFSFFGLIFLDDILFLFGASEATLPYAKDFMEIILAGNVITHVYFGLNNIMRATGHPKKAMVTAFISVGMNIILAPLFIFIFNWGIHGAALATVISQTIGLIWVLSHFFSKKTYIRFRKGYFRLNEKIVFAIFSIGMSPFLMNTCASAVAIIMNIKLKQYGGDLAIGAYGIVNSVATLIIMIIFGLNQGMQPIVGYNYGAKQNQRVFKTLKFTVFAGIAITTVSFVVFETMPHLISRAFTTDNELIELASNGMRITFLAFPVVGFQVVVSNFFQAIGKAGNAIIMSLSRQMLFLIPSLFILSSAWGLDGVWSASPFSDSLAAFLAAFLLWRQVRIIKKYELENKI